MLELAVPVPVGVIVVDAVAQGVCDCVRLGEALWVKLWVKLGVSLRVSVLDGDWL